MTGMGHLKIERDTGRGALHYSETLPQKEQFLEITNIPMAKRHPEGQQVALWGVRAGPDQGSGRTPHSPASRRLLPYPATEHSTRYISAPIYAARQRAPFHLPETPVGRSVL